MKLLTRLALGAGLLVSTGSAADPACQPILTAMTKMLAAPVHIYSTETAGYLPNGKPREGEVIYHGDAVYLRTRGTWTRSRMTISQVKAQQAENQKNTAGTCRVVREEAVNGDAATVYAMHQKTEDSIEDAQIWISHSRQLPLRDEIDIDVGGKMGKSHRSVRYDYANVQAPAVAK